MPSHLAARLRRAAPQLAELEEVTAATGQEAAHVPSHGDLDPKNTLVVGDQLLAVDWDAARMQPVAREAVGLALDWSTEPSNFQRVLAAYTAASGTEVPSAPWVFGGWVSALGGWLVYNATERIASDVGRNEVRLACSRLQALHDSLSEYLVALK